MGDSRPDCEVADTGITVVCVHAEDLSTSADAPIAGGVGLKPALFWSGVLCGRRRRGRTPNAESGAPGLVVELRQIAGSVLADGARGTVVLCVLEPAEGVLPATLDEHGDDALFGEGPAARRGVGGRGLHGVVGGYSAVISVTAERAEDSSTMAFLAA
jgi:hypothetical protein